MKKNTGMADKEVAHGSLKTDAFFLAYQKEILAELFRSRLIDAAAFHTALALLEQEAAAGDRSVCRSTIKLPVKEIDGL